MEKVVILGAGGRDFHNFNTVFRANPAAEVIAFTAAQIPYIENRVYPAELAGERYPDGIPIVPEERLPGLIRDAGATVAVFSYSDISHDDVMHRASLALSCGADFLFLGPVKTMLKSRVPVISVCAVRTGCGKSVITRRIAGVLKERGVRVAVLRHPMAYCDFIPAKRFSTMEEIDLGACTIEEREEFEPLVGSGITVYAGIDYQEVLRRAEKEADVLIWDGGNNDFPFVRPDLEIVLLDALRPGHETLFFPGEVNLRRGHVLIITKVNEARTEDRERMRRTIRERNPAAGILEAPSVLSLSDPSLIRGRKVLVVEDGPTITHGGMAHGAGVAASSGVAAEVVDPRPFAKGSILETYRKFPHIGPVLPAMGYSERQREELAGTIARADADVVVVATPVDLRRIIRIEKPTVRVFYDFDIDLVPLMDSFLTTHVP